MLSALLPNMIEAYLNLQDWHWAAELTAKNDVYIFNIKPSSDNVYQFAYSGCFWKTDIILWSNNLINFRSYDLKFKQNSMFNAFCYFLFR